MTPDQIAAVQSSFASVMPRADAVAQSFYARLFAADARLRPMFKGDMAEQRRKLMLTLSTVVHELGRIERVLPSVRALAVRHVGYGVVDRHYTLVGEALIGALAEHLPSFDARQRDAWQAAYSLVSRTMMDAARQSKTQRLAG